MQNVFVLRGENIEEMAYLGKIQNNMLESYFYS
jgi:hypothetical protein